MITKASNKSHLNLGALDELMGTVAIQAGFFLTISMSGISSSKIFSN